MLEFVTKRCDPACLQVWEVAGVWLASIGTLAAVLVSLALARRSRPQLKVTAGIRVMVTVGSTHMPEYVCVMVQNVGERHVRINTIAWRPVPWSKVHLMQIFDHDSPPLPYDLHAGNSVTFMTGLAGNPDLVPGLVRHAPGPKWLKARTLRVIAFTAIGDAFSAKVDSTLRDAITGKDKTATRA